MLEELLAALNDLDVFTLGALGQEILEQWTPDVNGNRDVVLTGKQRQHYLSRHPEMIQFEAFLRDAVLDPDYVYRNHQVSVAIFYRSLNSRYCLRVAVRIQLTIGLLKHSVLSYRLASVREMKKHQARCVWEKT